MPRSKRLALALLVLLAPASAAAAATADRAQTLQAIPPKAAGTTGAVATCPPLAFATPAQLPDAVQGKAYACNLRGKGGKPPLTFTSVDPLFSAAGAGGRPALQFGPSGAIRGVFAHAGSFTFLVKITDRCAAATQTGSRSFTVRVAPDPSTHAASGSQPSSGVLGPQPGPGHHGEGMGSPCTYYAWTFINGSWIQQCVGY